MGRAGAAQGAAQRQGATADSPALPLPQGQCAKVSSINDKNDWKVVRKALTVINFTEDEVEVRPLLGTLFPSVTPRKSQPTFTARIYLDPPSPLKHVTSQSLLHPTTPGCPHGTLSPSCDSPLPVPQDLLSIVASVLHLGNLHFAADEESNAQVTSENQFKYLTRVSGVSRGQGQSSWVRGRAPSPCPPPP